MAIDVLLCSPPVMSVVRPSIGLGLLHAAVAARGRTVETLHLNLAFADEIGLDLNEQLADHTPAHLLIGDWIFAGAAGGGGDALQVERHRSEMDALLQRRGIIGVPRLRDEVAAPFVAAATERILERRPRLVGFTTMFQQTMAALAIAARLKREDPGIAIVFGGANCHGPMGGALLRHYPQIDYVFTGEADHAFPDFTDALLDGGAPESGAGWIGRGGAPSNGTPVADLDALPFPDYRDYFRELSGLREADRVLPSIPFESSRGCWWGQKHHCTFCGLNAEGMAFRAKSTGRVLDELEVLERRHGVLRFAAADNILATRHIRELMPALALRDPKSPPRNFFYEVKANLNEEQLGRLAEAGVLQIQPGIESLADEVLAIMRKGVDSFLNLRLLRNCRELGISAVWSILHGFPGEPASAYREMAELVPLIQHLQPPTGLSPIRLDRFSPNFEQASEMGFANLRPMGAYGALHSMPPEDLADLAYFFEGTASRCADAEAVAPLRAMVADWKARWTVETAVPQLTFVRVATGMLVRDTRNVALEELHYLDSPAAALIDRLRDPQSLDAAFDALSPDWPRATLVAALDDLTRRFFLYRRGGKALSLPFEGGRTLYRQSRDDALGAVLAPSPLPVEAQA